MSITLEPIGYVSNKVDSPRDDGWAAVESKIIIERHLTPALDGLSEFSHILVVFWMHQAQPPTSLRRKPQGRDDMPETGLLAQRAKHRPNPIGITTVTLVSVVGNEVTVRELDAINGTPVLDIKPYYPDFDQPAGAKTPEWVSRLMDGYF